jgi:thiol-disulfide isomerase/thioredoxin
MKRANLVTGILLAVMLLGAGLIYQVFSANGVVPSASSISGAEQEAVGPVIPEVTLPTLDGEQVNLLRDRGEVTILFAMSYWCTTCVPEAQALAQLYEEYEAKGLKVVVIDVDEVSPAKLQTFIDLVGENRLIWAFDPEIQFLRRFKVQALDTTIIVNNKGREVYRDIRSTPYETLRNEIDALLDA